MKKTLLISAIALLASISSAGAQTYSFSSDLTVGSSGPDVVQLQTWLINNGFSIPAIAAGITGKGYFGSQTAAALQRYQAANGIPATGYFGPITRAHLNGGTVGGNPPYGALRVTSPNGGENWQVGTTQNITWTAPQFFRATYVNIQLLRTFTCTTQVCPMIAYAPQTIASNISIDNHSYPWVVGNTMNNYAAVTCDPIPANPITHIVPPNSNCANMNPYAAPAGQYRIQICETDNSVCDTSDATFNIYSGTSNGQQPVISGVDSPTSLAVNQTGTWTIHATDPLNGTLSYSVLWGDEAGYATTGGTTMTPAVMQTSTFTHSYANAGVYTVTFTVRNASGQAVQTSSTVNVTGSSNGAGPLRITSPNGGENWLRGSTQTITWTSPYYFAATTATLKLAPYQVCNQVCTQMVIQPYTIASIPINQNSYTWNVGSAIYSYGTQPNPTTVVPDGQYQVQICDASGNSCDTSDAPFTINSSTTNAPNVTVVSPNGGEQWAANSYQSINWSFTNTIAYNAPVDINLGQLLYVPCAYNPNNPAATCPQQFQSRYVLDRNVSYKPYSWVTGTDVNNNVIPAGTYAVQVCLAGSTNNCDTSNASFSIIGTAQPYYPPSTCPIGYTCTPATH